MTESLDHEGLAAAIHGPHELVRTVSLYAGGEPLALAGDSVPASALFPGESALGLWYARRPPGDDPP